MNRHIEDRLSDIESQIFDIITILDDIKDILNIRKEHSCKKSS